MMVLGSCTDTAAPGLVCSASALPWGHPEIPAVAHPCPSRSSQGPRGLSSGPGPSHLLSSSGNPGTGTASCAFRSPCSQFHRCPGEGEACTCRPHSFPASRPLSAPTAPPSSFLRSHRCCLTFQNTLPRLEHFRPAVLKPCSMEPQDSHRFLGGSKPSMPHSCRSTSAPSSVKPAHKPSGETTLVSP